jgi:Cu/Ag efflux protein CusF
MGTDLIIYNLEQFRHKVVVLNKVSVMKKILVIVLLVIVAAGLYGLYLYQKKPLDTHQHVADYELSAIDLTREFNADEARASSKFADKIVSVTGVAKEVERKSLTVFLKGSDQLTMVSCSFYVADSSQLAGIHEGDIISVKGKCTGKLSDVVLNNCTLLKSKSD